MAILVTATSTPVWSRAFAVAAGDAEQARTLMTEHPDDVARTSSTALA
jgi:hypothetical protein